MKSFIRKILSALGYEVRLKNSGFWDNDPIFLGLYKEIKSHTLVKIDRCFALYQYAQAALSLNGDVAELGVYKGGTAKLLSEVYKDTDKSIFLFDSFAGMPWKNDSEFKPGSESLFNDTSLQSVKSYLKDMKNIVFKPGFFPDTAQGLEEAHFCFVYLDADLEQSIKNGLDFFYRRLTQGGIIVIDDYGSRHWPGVKRAVDLFGEKNGIYPIWSASGQCVIIKH